MIGVFSSDYNNFEGLLKHVCLIKKYSYKEIKIAQVMIKNCQVLLVATGYNKINIGLALGYILKCYNLKAIINIGNCGVIDDSKYNIGDICISTSLIQYDLDSSTLGYAPGIIPGINIQYYSSNKKLVSKAIMVSQNLFHNTHYGIFGTAEKFIPEDKNKLKNTFNIKFWDMEAANYAQVGYLYGIATISIKSISHYLDDTAANSYLHYHMLANNKAGDVALGLIKELCC